jgi:putative ABC transport system substrate-binding protein
MIRFRLPTLASRRFALLQAAAVATGTPWLTLARAAGAPLVVWVGFGSLVPNDRPVKEPWDKAFRDLGYVAGQTLRLEYRYVPASPEGRAERLDNLLRQLLSEGVNVLFSPRVEVLLAAKRATSTVPIVFATIGDPVGAGVVDSLVHPGGNVTGISYDSTPEIAGKQLQLLHELVPGGRTFGLVAWKGSVDTRPFIEAARAAGRIVNVALLPFESRDGSDLEAAYAEFARRSVAGVLVLGSAHAFVHRVRLSELAAKHRLPAMYAMRESVTSGGLMSYGPIIGEQFIRAAVMIDKIMKGAKPGELPVEQPATFEFVINLKVARTLGLDVPRTLLLRADEVIA